MKIQRISAREILDSRGNPTVEVVVTLESQIQGKAAVPSGASTGSKEALELRDNDKNRFSGKGVLIACENIEKKIFPAIKKFDIFQQKEIDQAMLELDGTDNKSSIGANAIIAVSMAVAKAAAKEKKQYLWQYLQTTFDFKKHRSYKFPVPMMNVINGGAHSDSGLDIQEFMVVPSRLTSFAKRLQAGTEIYHSLAKVLLESGYRTAIGDEGGYAPGLQSNQEALQLILKAIANANYTLGAQVKTGIDAAASEFFEQENRQYNLKMDDISLDSNQLSAMYRDWIDKFQLELIEDPFSEFDWDGWVKFTHQTGEAITIIADDLTVTNKRILAEAIERKASNAVLIKVNQIGTVSETMETIELAKKYNFKIAVSHRSGETLDDFIADLAVAVEADYLKAGAPARGERVAKYNRVMEIEKWEW